MEEISIGEDCWSVTSHIESMELKRKEERLKTDRKLEEKS